MILVGALFLASAIAVIMHTNIEKVIGLAIIGITMVVYSFSLVGIPMVGVYLSILIVSASVIYDIVCAISRKELIRQYVFTYGGIASLFFLIIYLLHDSGRSASFGIDPMYWVGRTKDFYITNDLSTSGEATHPMFFQILSYTAMKTWMRWADGILIFAKDFFVVTLLVPLYAFLNEKLTENKLRFISNVILFIIVLLVPFTGVSDKPGVYGVDTPLGIMVGMALVFWVSAIEKENNDYIIAISYMVVAVLTKRSGIIMIAIVMLWLVPYLYISKRKVCAIVSVLVVSIAYIIFFRFDKYSLLPVLCIIIAYFCNKVKWGTVIKKIKQLDDKALWLLFCGLFVCATILVNDLWLRKDLFVEDVARVYVEACLTPDKYSIGNIIHMGIAFFLLLLIVIYHYYLRKYINDIEKVFFWGLILSSVLYLLAFYYLYPTTIAPVNFPVNSMYTAGFERYISTIYIVGMCYFVYLGVRHVLRIYNVAAVLVFVLCLINPAPLYSFLFVSPQRFHFEGFDKANIQISENTKISYVTMDKTGMWFAEMVSFELDYMPAEVIFVDINEELESETFSVDNLRQKLMETEYVYVDNLSGDFIAEYADDIFVNTSEYNETVFAYDQNKNLYAPLGE